jgi:hypothetical protein
MDLSGSNGVTVKKPGKLGFQGGFIGYFGINKSVAVQFEVLFSQKGVTLKGTSQGTSVKVWETVNYLEIPLLLKFYALSKRAIIYGDIGPDLGIGLFANMGSSWGESMDIKFEKGGINRIDIGIAFGAGVGYTTGKGQIFLDLRYCLGLKDLNNLDESDKDVDYKPNCNRNFGIAVGFIVNLGKKAKK